MSPKRGQTLLMFALMLLILTLTVLVTLGIASRVHDRMEAQIAADAAAYSEAVLTARTFNAISIINRAQVGKMVAMAAVESLISWTGASYGNMVELTDVSIPEAQAKGTCGPELTALLNAITAAKAVKDAQFEKLDDNAGHQARNIQGSASGMRTAQTELMKSLVSLLAQDSTSAVPNICPNCTPPQPPLLPSVASKDLVKKLVKGANPQLDTPAKGGDWKSLMEVQTAVGLTDSSPTTDSVYATMGSIGDPFVNSRASGSGDFATGITTYGAVGFSGGSSGGGAGFGSLDDGFKQSETRGGASSYAAWALDRGGSFSFTLACADGSATLTGTTTDAHVYSSELQQNDDEHVYGGTDTTNPPDERHTMGACVSCDGIWPFFLDYVMSSAGATDPLNRPVNTKDNLYGQPVLYAMVQRDYSKVKDDPWNLRFDFHFTPEGAEFDNGGRKPDGKVKKGLTDPALEPFTRQVVLSAGLAYYHRHGHAKEPPNFFNPFWRATLIPPEIDSANGVSLGTGGDAVRALNRAGFGAHAEALKALEKNGYMVTELSP